MNANESLRTATALLAAIALAAAGLAIPAASASTDAADTSIETAAGPPCGKGYHTIVEAGPVWIYYDPYCIPGASVDGDWSLSEDASALVDAPETESAASPPCGPEPDTIADVGPVHVYLDAFICFPRVDVDEDWEPEDELTASSSIVDAPETELAASPPCGPGLEKIAEVGPVTVYEDPWCFPYIETDGDWEPSDELP